MSESARKKEKETNQEEESSLPSGKTKPLEGTIKADEKFGYLSELVAYHSMKASAKAIGEEINILSLGKESKILVADKLDISEIGICSMQIESSLALFAKQFKKQLKVNYELTDFAKQLKKQLKVNLELTKNVQDIRVTGKTMLFFPSSELLSAVPGIISTIADIAGYFKVDYDIKGKEITLKKNAVVAFVIKEISKNHDIRLLDFNLMDKADESETLKQLALLTQKRNEIRTSIKMLKSRKKTSENKEKIDAAIKESVKTIEAFDTFVESIKKTEKGEKQPLLVSAIQYDHIKKMDITHLLYIEIVSSGGEVITEKHIWTSGHTAFIGGSTLSYMLAKREGKIVSADTFVAFSELDYKIDSQVNPKIRVVKLP